MSKFFMTRKSRTYYEQEVKPYRHLIGEQTQYWIPLVARAYNPKTCGKLHWPEDYVLVALVQTDDLDEARFFLHSDIWNYRDWVTLNPPYSFRTKSIPEENPQHDVYVLPSGKVYRLHRKGAAIIGRVHPPKNKSKTKAFKGKRKPKRKTPSWRQAGRLQKLFNRNDYEYRQAKILFAKILIATLFLVAIGICKQLSGEI